MLKKLFYSLLILALIMTGSKVFSTEEFFKKNNDITGRNKEVFTDARCEEISSYLSGFKRKYVTTDNLQVESRSIVGESTEGGVIVRYKEKTGIILRYRLTLYGETGRVEENYYFVKDYIYYSGLEEIYSSPIYIPTNTDILVRVLKQGVILNGICYYDISDTEISGWELLGAPYTSLEQLEELFQRSISQ